MVYTILTRNCANGLENEQNIGYKSRRVKHFCGKDAMWLRLGTIYKSDWLWLNRLFTGNVSRETASRVWRCFT